MASIALAAFLPACQTGSGGTPMSVNARAASPVTALQHINETAHTCWLAGGDRDFRDLRLVPELDTTSGTPRILVVHAGKAQGLPALVIEAKGEPVTVQTYGPLVTTPTGARINRDIKRWSSGEEACA